MIRSVWCFNTHNLAGNVMVLISCTLYTCVKSIILWFSFVFDLFRLISKRCHFGDSHFGEREWESRHTGYGCATTAP